MLEFKVGQRWINDAQLQMGLGTVMECDFRTVTVAFPSTGETFTYAKESVPLTRIRFAPDDEIHLGDGTRYVVKDVEEVNHLLIYHAQADDGTSHYLNEQALSDLVELKRPSERMFNGQLDRPGWFEARLRTHQLRAQVAKHPLRGLIGCRIDLIPHQLYLAYQIAKRHAPRVLLADEVGLGKTIEAGMVLHQQIITERAKRVLVIVPETLTHQWLVEMLRRFNLRFKLVGDAEYSALVEEGSSENLYEDDQLVITSLETLITNPQAYKDCLKAQWDLLVVDEAHHLQWSAQGASPQYQVVEQLAEQSPGILLLTATPEQLGKQSHYARLRLLDSQRYPDFASFESAESSYQPLAKLVEAIHDGVALSAEHQQLTTELLGAEADKYLPALINGKADASASAELADEASADATDDVAITPTQDQDLRDDALNLLLDRHGTGRVLFRNTRAAIQGFPERHLKEYPHPLPDVYRDALVTFQAADLNEPQLLLCPELLYQALSEAADEGADWIFHDPRINTLVDLLKEYRRHKVLVITASAGTAMDLVEALRLQGIQSALFHEGLSIVDRDRAAAWFADTLSGAQVMVCSEIGSEGRNFQFSNQLVLFDLPLNPDLLEQRIGRLDRIGQQSSIDIHLLYLEESAQWVMYRWYHEAMNAFEHTSPTGRAVFESHREALLSALHHPEAMDDKLIEAAKESNADLLKKLEDGRDRLLELNSCRSNVAKHIQDDARRFDDNVELRRYFEGVMTMFGVEHEVHSEGCYTIIPGPHMLLPIPYLKDEGMTVTYSRNIALSFEDVHYLTWDHPMVIAVMDIIEQGDQGNTAFIALPIAGVPRGTIMMESVYLLQVPAGQGAPAQRFMATQPIKIILDNRGQIHDIDLARASENPERKRISFQAIKQMMVAKQNLLRKMVKASEVKARQQMPALIEQAMGQAEKSLEYEIKRLRALQAVNPMVRDSEIEHIETTLHDVKQRLGAATLQLDALRVVVAG